MVDTPKNDYWQRVTLTPTGVTPGTYPLAQVTVNNEGRVTSISSGAASSATVVSTVSDLPTIIGPTNGQLAVVLDDGAGNEELYVWNDANADSGAPLNKWRLIASTGTATFPFGYRQSAIGTGANQTIGLPIPDVGIIKEVNVEITTPYSAGTTISIEDDNAFVYMPSTDINAELAGLYKTDLSGNLNDIQTNSAPGDGQMRAIIGGAPAAGAASVYITFVQ